MPAAVGPLGNTYLWRDGSTSSLAPPSDAVDIVLQNPTRWAADNGTAISYDRIYREQPFVGAAARFVAGQVARLPLQRFLRNDVRERDTSSILARALRNPGPRRTRHAFKRAIALGLAVHGNHLEEIVRDGGTVTFRRILWKHVRPVWNDAKTEIVGWEIHDQGAGEKPRKLSNFEVIHFAVGATDSPLGVSPLEQLGTSLLIDRAAQAHQLATLRNSARVGVVVVIDPQYAKDQALVETVRAEFGARYAGVQNSGRPFVSGGIDLKNVPQQTMVEAELINQRKVTREEAAAVYQIPVTFLGDMSKSTQNNLDSTYKQLFKTTLPELLDNICETIDCHVLDAHPDAAPEESFSRFNIDAIMWGDPAERGATYERLLGVGAITVDEIRDLEDRHRFEMPETTGPMLKISNYQPIGADPLDGEQSPDDGQQVPAE